MNSARVPEYARVRYIDFLENTTEICHISKIERLGVECEDSKAKQPRPSLLSFEPKHLQDFSSNEFYSVSTKRGSSDGKETRHLALIMKLGVTYDSCLKSSRPRDSTEDTDHDSSTEELNSAGESDLQPSTATQIIRKKAKRMKPTNQIDESVPSIIPADQSQQEQVLQKGTEPILDENTEPFKASQGSQNESVHSVSDDESEKKAKRIKITNQIDESVPLISSADQSQQEQVLQKGTEPVLDENTEPFNASQGSQNESVHSVSDDESEKKAKRIKITNQIDESVPLISSADQSQQEQVLQKGTEPILDENTEPFKASQGSQNESVHSVSDDESEKKAKRIKITNQIDESVPLISSAGQSQQENVESIGNHNTEQFLQKETEPILDKNTEPLDACQGSQSVSLHFPSDDESEKEASIDGGIDKVASLLNELTTPFHSTNLTSSLSPVKDTDDREKLLLRIEYLEKVNEIKDLHVVLFQKKVKDIIAKVVADVKADVDARLVALKLQIQQFKDKVSKIHALALQRTQEWVNQIPDINCDDENENYENYENYDNNENDDIYENDDIDENDEIDDIDEIDDTDENTSLNL